MSDQTPTPDWAHITITNERVVLSGGEDLGPASPPLKVSHSCEALPEGEYLLVPADDTLYRIERGRAWFQWFEDYRNGTAPDTLYAIDDMRDDRGVLVPVYPKEEQ